MRHRVLSVFSVLLMATGAANGQQPLGPPASTQPGHYAQVLPPGAPPRTPPPDPVGENLFPPELVMSHQQAIGLDENQKTSIRSELLKTQTRFTELQWQLQDAMESLVSLLKNTTVDEQQVLTQLDKVLNNEREIKRAQLGLMVRIKNRLTPEQQARLRQFREGGPPRPEALPR